MQNFCPPRRQLLAAAIGFALLSPFTLHAQQVVADGDAQTPAAGDYTTTEPVDVGSTAGYALYAINQGTITPAGVVNLSTSGLGAAAAHASGDLSAITLTAGNINTSGNNAAGLSVADGGTISAARDADGNAIRITTTGSGSHGVAAASNGVVNLDGATLRTEGNFAAGIKVAGDAQVTLTGGSIETLGSQSYGVDVSAGTAMLTGTVVRTQQSNALQITGSGRLQADGVVVETLGVGGYGLVAQSGATATFRNGRISTSGASATGVALGGDVTLHNTDVLTNGNNASAADVSSRNSHLQMQGGSLTTTGFGATALRLMDDGRATLERVQITTHGQGSYGIDMNGARNVLALDRVNVVTHGEVSKAISALNASTATITDSHLETHGRQSVGIDVRHTTVTLADTRVITHGDGGAHALYVSRDAGHGAQGSIDGERVEAITHGAGAAGVYARMGGVVTLRDSLVHTTGSGSAGVLAADRGTIGLNNTHVLTEGVDAWAADVRAGGTFSMHGGSLVSAQHAWISAVARYCLVATACCCRWMRR